MEPDDKPENYWGCRLPAQASLPQAGREEEDPALEKALRGAPRRGHRRAREHRGLRRDLFLSGTVPHR